MTGIIPEEPTTDNMQRVFGRLVGVDDSISGWLFAGSTVIWEDDYDEMMADLRHEKLKHESENTRGTDRREYQASASAIDACSVGKSNTKP